MTKKIEWPFNPRKLTVPAPCGHREARTADPGLRESSGPVLLLQVCTAAVPSVSIDTTADHDARISSTFLWAESVSFVFR